MISSIGVNFSILLRSHSSKRFCSLWSKRSSSSSSSSAVRCSSLQPPDVAQLADTARITLSSKEVEDFAPKIKQVVDWFGQLQAIDLESVEPSLRADSGISGTPREDIPKEFENREAILTEIPCFADSYIKVPKVLNKE